MIDGGETASAASAPAAILGVATRLFAEKGYGGASVREIAERAGVAKPTIYYYFKSKEGLLEEVLDAAFSPLLARLREINARDEGADAVECLEAAVGIVFEYAVERRDLTSFAYSCVYGPRNQPAGRIIMEDFSEVIDELRLLVERAVRAGIIARERLEEAVKALRGMIDVYISDYLLGLSGELDAGRSGVVVAGLLRGYGGPGLE